MSTPDPLQVIRESTSELPHASEAAWELTQHGHWARVRPRNGLVRHFSAEECVGESIRPGVPGITKITGRPREGRSVWAEDGAGPALSTTRFVERFSCGQRTVGVHFLRVNRNRRPRRMSSLDYSELLS